MCVRAGVCICMCNFKRDFKRNWLPRLGRLTSLTSRLRARRLETQGRANIADKIQRPPSVRILSCSAEVRLLVSAC